MVLDDQNFPDRRVRDLNTEYKRRASDLDDSYEWLLKQIRNSLITSADTTGEVSALNKDLKEISDKILIVEVKYNKDMEYLKNELKRFSDDFKEFKNFFTFPKLIAYTSGISAIIIGIVELSTTIYNIFLKTME